MPEDFATTHMPAILAEFTKAHPQVALEVTCDLTMKLLETFRKGEFDLVLVKREPAAKAEGVRVWREALVWVAGEGYAMERKAPLSLVASPEPCVYRKRAIDALNKAGKAWRMAYTCGALAGSQAAVRAGLGVTVLPRDMVPEGLKILESSNLPALRDTEIALLAKPPLSKPVERLRDHIVSSLERSDHK
jgi:DNA-binding transcriptional LysR family regulator